MVRYRIVVIDNSYYAERYNVIRWNRLEYYLIYMYVGYLLYYDYIYHPSKVLLYPPYEGYQREVYDNIYVRVMVCCADFDF